VSYGEDPWRVGRLDPKDPANDPFSARRVLPDGRTSRPEEQPQLGAVLMGVLSITLLGACQGMLGWAALSWAATLGWLDTSPPILPLIGIGVCLAFARAFDKVVFRRR
jgi:hypothetical protein